MTPRRHRLFLDHKPPLVAFVLVAVACMGVLVHVARSEAAPGWLRSGAVSVVSGGAPLTRHVVERTALAPEQSDVPVADPPLAAPPAAPATPAEPATESASGSGRHSGPVVAHAGNGGRTTPVLAPNAPPAQPSSPATPSSPPSTTPPVIPGWKGHGVAHHPSGVDGDRGDDQGWGADDGDDQGWNDEGRGDDEGWGADDGDDQDRDDQDRDDQGWSDRDEQWGDGSWDGHWGHDSWGDSDDDSDGDSDGDRDGDRPVRGSLGEHGHGHPWFDGDRWRGHGHHHAWGHARSSGHSWGHR